MKRLVFPAPSLLPSPSIKPGGIAQIFQFHAAGSGKVFINPAGSSVMVDDLERAREGDAGSRNGLKSLHLKLSQYSKKKIPAHLRAEEAQSTELAYVQRILDTQILGYARRSSVMQKQEAFNASRKLAMALFLMERTVQIRDESLKQDNAGLYALYFSIRKDVCRMLGSSYYAKPFEAIMTEYLDIEPRISAASKLCGFLPPPEAANIPSAYQPRLVELINKA
ncbi:MAG: hypothetical protein PHV13_02745 [Candidatus ainarchaeum sp.]|nr:hypothetical protein [Candidatus ainarchaeum sp.]